ncbi:MAG: MBL fold metallo-hydrolase [Rhodothermales bacterium]
MINTWSALGTSPKGSRLERMQQSPQYGAGKFVNRLPPKQIETLHVLKRWFFEKTPNREPASPVPVVQRSAADFAVPADTLQVTWFGHSSLLVELEGKRILVDPVWGDYASPGRIFGVKRFYAPPIALEDLPAIDAVVLSHDHYDHLNEPTIKALKDKVPMFVVPLGLGAHLEYWGVSPDRITELDWWEQVEVGNMSLVCTPARHFSGRGLTDGDATLWAGWAFVGQSQRAFYSGDSGMFPGFKDIGDRLGPFDITMMETGAYNSDWPDVHMGPEQAVKAHQMVRGDIMLPVHWGTFALAFHGWTEPAERVLAAAAEVGVSVATPNPGESISVAASRVDNRWWPALPWKTAAETPIVSTGLGQE